MVFIPILYCYIANKFVIFRLFFMKITPSLLSCSQLHILEHNGKIVS
jgi:hypothetical protein